MRVSVIGCVSVRVNVACECGAMRVGEPRDKGRQDPHVEPHRPIAAYSSATYAPSPFTALLARTGRVWHGVGQEPGSLAYLLQHFAKLAAPKRRRRLKA